MKNAPRGPPKWSWKSGSGSNSIAIASWVALLAMFSAVFVSILWETLTRPPHPPADKNQTYKYPMFVLDFERALQDRESVADKVYEHVLDDLKVERRSGLPLQEFWDLYDAKWPVLITDVVPKWPAYNLWSKNFFNTTYWEDRVMMKAVKGSLHDAEGLAVPLFRFVDHTCDSNPNYWTYVTDEVFIPTRPQLRKDIGSSIYTEEDFFLQFPAEIRPWDCMLLWGTAHSRSSLHLDPYNWTGTNAVLWGTKKWKLFPPGQDHLLHVTDQRCGFPLECIKHNSEIDAFASESENKRYPGFKFARYIEVEQKRGEMLIIPTGWFHQAYNTEETLAVSGQMMNRNNYRFVLEEVLRAGNLPRKQLPAGFHHLLPPDQVSIFMSLLPKKILKKGKAVTDHILSEVNNVNRPKVPGKQADKQPGAG